MIGRVMQGTAALFLLPPLRTFASAPQSLRGEAFQLAAATGMSMALGLVGRMLIPRVVGADAYGSLRVAEASADLVFVLLGFGLDALLRREVARDPQRVSAHVWPVLLFRALAGVLVLGAGALWLTQRGSGGTALSLFLVLGAGQLALSLSTAASAVQQALGRGHLTARANVAAKFVWLAAIVLVLVSRPTLLLVALAGAMIEIVRAGRALRALCLLAPPSGASWRFAPEWIREAVPFAINALAHGLYARLGVWWLHETHGARETGLLGGTAQIAAIALLGVPLLFSILLPALSRDRDGADARAGRLLRTMLMTGVPLGALAMLTAPWWTTLVLGADFMGSVPAMRWQIATVLLTYVASLSAIVLLVRGSARRVASISMFGLLFAIFATWLLLPSGTVAEGVAATRGAQAMFCTELFVATLLLGSAISPKFAAALHPRARSLFTLPMHVQSR